MVSKAKYERGFKSCSRERILRADDASEDLESQQIRTQGSYSWIVWRRWKKKTFPHTGNVLQMGGDGIGVNPSRRGKRQDRHLSRRGDVSRRPPSPPEEEEEEEQREEEQEEKHPRASPALKAGGVTSERD